MKTLRCRDVGFDCQGELRAESDEEILRQAAEHVRQVHGMDVTPELVEQVRTQIREESAA
jgi:predicted small metal-binding protein